MDAESESLEKDVFAIHQASIFEFATRPLFRVSIDTKGVGQKSVDVTPIAIGGAILAVWGFMRAKETLWQAFLPEGQSDVAVKGRVIRPITRGRGGKPKVILIGAGPAGLAASAELHRQGIPYVCLEQGLSAGESWLKRYDRLALHTPRAISQLPGFPFPDSWTGSWPVYVCKDDISRYYAAAAEFLRVYTGVSVSSVRRNETTGEYTVRAFCRTRDGERGVRLVEEILESANIVKEKVEGGWEVTWIVDAVVVCVGNEAEPKVPEDLNLDAFNGRVIHSSAYKTGKEFQGQNVAVVGFGNSGCEIMMDLYEHDAKPFVVTRSPVHLFPRGLLKAAAWDVYPISRYVLPLAVRDFLGLCFTAFTMRGLPLQRKISPAPATFQEIYGLSPVIDIGSGTLMRQGKVQVYNSKIKSVQSNHVILDDDTKLNADAIIFCTGYSTHFAKAMSFLPAEQVKSLVNPETNRIHSGEQAPNLFFIGFNAHTGRLAEINIDAAQLRQTLVQRGF